MDSRRVQADLMLPRRSVAYRIRCTVVIAVLSVARLIAKLFATLVTHGGCSESEAELSSASSSPHGAADTSLLPDDLQGVKTLISLRTEPVMVLILLEVRAELDNVNSIRLPKGTTYTLTVKNSSGEDTREGVEVSSADEVELAGSRGTANFALKWARDARQQANLQVVEDIKGLALRYTAEDGQNYAPLVGFECRGLEPIAWFPSDGFLVEGTGAHTFQDVDLSDDWADFDEKTGNAVSVMDLEWRFSVRR